MQKVSNAFMAAMAASPYVARITLDGTDVIQGKAVLEMYFRGGSNANEEMFVIGSAVSGSVEMTLDKAMVGVQIENRELFVELGIELPNGTEWLPIGTYTAEKPTADDGVITVVAQDALYAKFNVDYEPLEGFDFGTENSVLSTEFLGALCARRGVTVELSGLEHIPLSAPPDGFTERQIIGFISALYGGYANIDRLGVLRICHYTETDLTVTADDYYENGMEKAAYGFRVGWLRCYNELTDLTMFVGDPNAGQGIYIENIWMNQQILNGIWEKYQNFSFCPVKGVSFMGNPLIDPGDIIYLEDLASEKVRVPAMAISHEFDGGLKTNVAAYGQSKTTVDDGTSKQVAFRAAKRAAANAKDYSDQENKKLDQTELMKRLTKDWVDDGIYLTDEGKIAINASAILAGIIRASLIQTGVLQSKDGKSFVLDLDNNILKGAFSELSVSGKTVDQIAQEKLDTYAAEVSKDIENLQNQIDGNITSWFGDYVPTASNEPASGWTTEDLKSQHLGDLFYINEGAGQGGTVYRWTLVNGVYQWVIVEDTDVAKALAAAAAAQDTADSKRRVFVVQPTPPYDVGDLWAQGSGGDLMRCKTSRASGSYSASDWELASKYIDAASAGTIAQGKVDAQSHADIFNKWTDGGKIQGIYSQNGKWYINAEIAQIVNLIAQKLTSLKDGFTLNIDGAQMVLQNRFGETFSVRNADDLAYMYFEAYDANGNDIGRSQFGANRIFLGGTWADPAFKVEAQYLSNGKKRSTMQVNRINPGKKKLWSGTCAVGATITVENTADYDLFAIRLGDDGGTYTQTVLAYKSGSEISGIGGWSGTASKYKDIQFVTFTVTGNSWYLEDCGYHYVYSGGGTSAGTKVSVREIYGII